MTNTTWPPRPTLSTSTSPSLLSFGKRVAHREFVVHVRSELEHADFPHQTVAQGGILCVPRNIADGVFFMTNAGFWFLLLLLRFFIVLLSGLVFCFILLVDGVFFITNTYWLSVFVPVVFLFIVLLSCLVLFLALDISILSLQLEAIMVLHATILIHTVLKSQARGGRYHDSTRSN